MAPPVPGWRRTCWWAAPRRRPAARAEGCRMTAASGTKPAGWPAACRAWTWGSPCRAGVPAGAGGSLSGSRWRTRSPARLVSAYLQEKKSMEGNLSVLSAAKLSVGWGVDPLECCHPCARAAYPQSVGRFVAQALPFCPTLRHKHTLHLSIYLPLPSARLLTPPLSVRAEEETPSAHWLSSAIQGEWKGGVSLGAHPSSSNYASFPYSADDFLAVLRGGGFPVEPLAPPRHPPSPPSRFSIDCMTVWETPALPLL